MGPSLTGKPNILMIMVDDLGFNDLAINNGNINIDTPNMDQIAREGVRFTRHYGSSVCAPARAALLTGMFPERVGFMSQGSGISSDFVTLPERLQQEGYSTWHIGKWHIGDFQRESWPDHQGFDHWFGFVNQWRMAAIQTGTDYVPNKPTYLDPYLEGDSIASQQFPGHLETILTDKTLAVLDDLQAEEAPWFVNLWFYAPHAPITPTPEFAAMYPATPAGKYRALVKQLDTNIGRITSHLDAIGEKQDTIIVIVSDNGGTNAALDSNHPFFGKKSTVTEGALRTPLLILWPEAGPNGQVVDDTISIQDIYPTLLEAIGARATDGLDGRSHYQSLWQKEPAPRRALFWEFATSRSYGMLSADGRWRLYQPFPYYGAVAPHLLYDFQADPTASNELQPAPAAQVSLMKQGYENWYRDVHKVQTTYTQDANGGGVLTGRDLLRTPGNGWFTFAIGVPDQFEGQVVEQLGVWDMQRAGRTITASFGAWSLTGEISNSNACHNVVVSGRFARKIANFGPPDSIRVALYIDELEVDALDVEHAFVPRLAPDMPTVIGDPRVSTGNNNLVEPMVFNTEVREATPLTLTNMNQVICKNS